MAADVVVIALGPWTSLAAEWFEGIPRIGAQKAHSIVIKPAEDVSPDCLFLAHTNKQGTASLPHYQSKPHLGQNSTSSWLNDAFFSTTFQVLQELE